MNGHAVMIQSAASACRPRRRLSVSEWADAHRVLSSKASSESGPWRTKRTPYLKEIMDCLSLHSSVQRVVVIKSAQVGLTEVALNFVGYVIDHAPASMLVVVPTLEVRDRWIMQRLHPMLRETPVLIGHFDAKRSRDSANSKDIKDFTGGMLVLSGANSPSSLRSMPIRYVVNDELDAFPWDAKGEGDPLGLIRARQSNFPRRKELNISTPTIKEASRIDEEYEKSDQRRYHVPCPECGDLLILRWQNLSWDNALTRAWYICEHCGSEIEEHHKPRMLADGRWVPGNPSSTVRGYHINGLYAPIGLGFSWIELARQWKDSQDDPSKLKRFINTVLGEAWEDRSRDIKPNALMERSEPYPLRTVPPGCMIITAGVDTQDDRLSVQLLGWGRQETCWVLDWVELPGNPAQAQVWNRLTELLTTPLHNRNGVELHVQATAIDSGGHHTHDVYRFVRSQAAKRLMAIKGANTPGKPILSGRPTAQDINWRGKTIKKGVHLWTLGVDTAKHALFGRLNADAGTEPSGRKVRFSEQLPTEYFDQLTSEAFDPEKNRWVRRRGRRNEGLDTWVYGYAAAMHPELRVHAMRQKDWERLEQMLLPADDPDKPVTKVKIKEQEQKPNRSRRLIR